jgi:hypothetical protein
MEGLRELCKWVAAVGCVLDSEYRKSPERLIVELESS